MSEKETGLLERLLGDLRFAVANRIAGTVMIADSDADLAISTIERLQAKLAECQRERDSSKNNWEVAERVVAQLQKELAEWKDCALNGGATQTMVKQNTALAAIVKQQREALIGVLSLDEEHQRGADDIDVCYEVRRGREALALDTTTADVVLAEYRREVMSIPDSRFIHSTDCADDEPKTTHHDRYMFRVGWNACRALIAAPAQGESKEGK